MCSFAGKILTLRLKCLNRLARVEEPRSVCFEKKSAATDTGTAYRVFSPLARAGSFQRSVCNSRSNTGHGIRNRLENEVNSHLHVNYGPFDRTSLPFSCPRVLGIFRVQAQTEMMVGTTAYCFPICSRHDCRSPM